MKLDTILKVMQALGLNPLQEVGVMKRKARLVKTWRLSLNPLQEVGVMKLHGQKFRYRDVVLIPFRKSG